MSLTDTQRDAFAHALYEADQSQSQIPIISQDHPGLDLEDAYAIQSALVQRFVQAGRVIKGWKIGLTSKAMQYALNIDIPDSGVLFEDMFFENGGDVPTSRFIATRIEAEICFIMKADLSGPNVTREDVIAATDSVCPSLEILDTRIIPKDPQTGAIRKVTDTISDNAANAGIVLGTSATPLMTLICAGSGPSAAATEKSKKPAWALVCWMIRLWALSGLPTAWRPMVTRLAPVMSCSAGSFIRPVQAPKGCEISADFGPFGSVSCRFV